MCSVSAVSEYYQNQFPQRQGYNPFQSNHLPLQGLGGQPVVTTVVDAETKEMMRQVLKMLDKIDKKLGDVECLDETKAAFLKSLDLDPANISGG